MKTSTIAGVMLLLLAATQVPATEISHDDAWQRCLAHTNKMSPKTPTDTNEGHRTAIFKSCMANYGYR